MAENSKKSKFNFTEAEKSLLIDLESEKSILSKISRLTVIQFLSKRNVGARFRINLIAHRAIRFVLRNL